MQINTLYPISLFLSTFLVLSFSVLGKNKYGLHSEPAADSGKFKDQAISTYGKSKSELLFGASWNFLSAGGGESQTSLMLAEKYSFRRKIFIRRKNIALELNSELAFLFRGNKEWNKEQDRHSIYMNYRQEEGSLWERELSLRVAGSLYPYLSIAHTTEQIVEEGLKSKKIFLPGEIHFQYGWSRKVGELLDIKGSLASVRVTCQPQVSGSGDEINKIKRLWRYYYGCTLEGSINKKIGERFVWDCRFRLFMNSPENESLFFEVEQNLRYRITNKLLIYGANRYTFEPAVNAGSVWKGRIQLTYLISSAH